MHTKDKLAAELKRIGLDEMAAKAATGYYHDFLSPLTLPEIQLVNDLMAERTPERKALAQRVVDGDFDATTEEGQAWADGEGQAIFGRLISGR